MRFVIDTEECEKEKISFPTFLYLLSVYTGQLITESCYYNASSQSLLTFKSTDMYGNPISPALTEFGEESVKLILQRSEKKIPSDNEIVTISEALREIFPAGKKPGTPYYWKDSVKGIEQRVKQFFIKYGNKYTEEQIVKATKDYVDSFNGDYRFMRLLKYFIWKKDDGGEISELASFIDNAGQENEDDNNWVTELR